MFIMYFARFSRDEKKRVCVCVYLCVFVAFILFYVPYYSSLLVLYQAYHEILCVCVVFFLATPFFYSLVAALTYVHGMQKQIQKRNTRFIHIEVQTISLASYIHFTHSDTFSKRTEQIKISVFCAVRILRDITSNLFELRFGHIGCRSVSA